MTPTIPAEQFVALWHNAVQAAVVAGVHEEGGNNRGQQVESYQRACGGEPGESWCMYFQIFYALKTLARLKGLPINPQTIVETCLSLHGALTAEYGILVTGSCGEAMRHAQGRGKWIDRAHVVAIQPGDLALYAWNDADLEARTPRHVGMAHRLWLKAKGGTLGSLEGNTGAPGGNQSDGDGAYLKERSLANLVGIITTF